MDNSPFDTIALTSDTIDWYNDTYTALKAKFGIQLTYDINFQLEQFEVFRGYVSINIRGSFVIKQDNNNDCYILFVETVSRVAGRQGIAEIPKYQVWALAYLKNDFGRVLIRRETLADKIIELVHPVELDFDEDKPFSDTFYVLINDREKATRAIDRNFRNAVMDVRMDNFMIEVVEHSLIIGDYDPVSPEKTIHMAEFITRICSHCW
ncbi:hypothetical protein KXD93_19590 [Mucilaginibacter sp. BJC16-A38]|uniref:hypothetical protein n=1 Tax=Mucilaginibacter phenanthrenivorans TaxID=1234842 RepID=UPI0021580A5C|nr:hypothetical protein [Mucilaginibacter phenanthrenivorans]MCR8559863.1 hypothetical protein [Mucilaginibacter phenanthrenivorans]